MDQVLEEYKEKKGGLYGKEANSLLNFINMLKEISEQEFLERLNEDMNHEEIFKYLSPDNTQINTYLDQRFNLTKKLNPFSDEYYLTQEFIDHFKDRVPALMSFHFRADLKKGQEAKQAMDLLYHETVREAVNQISNKEDEQLRILLDIRDKVKKISELDSFERSCISDATQNLLGEIYEEIRSIRRETAHIINLINTKPFLSFNDESDEPDFGTLFSYKQKYTSLVGREVELNLLQNFIDDKRGFSWMAITGPGGIGKSRLALEITEIARTQKFHSGFWDISRSFNWDTWGPSIATFIVIDYAFSDYQKVFDLIELLRKRDKQKELDNKNKIRILLLDRELRADWKKEIEINDAIRNSNFLKDSQEKFYELKALENSVRWQIIREIINKSDLEVNKMTDLIGLEEEVIRKLNELDPKKRPLFAFFTGIAIVQEGGLKKIENWNQNDLIEHHLIRLENDIWAKTKGYKENKFGVKNLILVNTLCRELLPNEIAKVAEKFKIDMDFFVEEYPLFVEIKKDSQGKVEKYYGIQPDILGEYFILLMNQEITLKPINGRQVWLDLQKFSYELKIKNILQTLDLIRNDFKLFDEETLRDMSKENIAEYDKLIKDSPENYFYYLERGGCKYNIEQYNEALSDFNTSIQINSGNNFSYYRRGLAKWRLDQFHEAIADFDIAIELYPDWEGPIHDKGFQFYELGKYEEAIIYYNTCLSLNNKFILAYQNRANAKFKLEKYEEAIADYTKVIELSSSDDSFYRRGYTGRGHAEFSLGKYDEAIADYDVAIKLNSTDADLYKFRGHAKYYLKKYKGAISDYDKAIDLDQNIPDYLFYRNRGHVKYFLEKYEEAILDLEKAIEFNPNNYEIYEFYGFTYAKLQKYEKSLAAYDKAIELNPAHFIGYLNRGITKYYSGKFKYEDIITDLNEAIDINDNDYSLYEQRGALKNIYGKVEEAIGDFDKAIALNTNNYSLLFQRGKAKMGLRRFEEVVEDMNSIIKSDNKFKEAYTLRGKAQYQLNNLQVAYEDFIKAISLGDEDAKGYLKELFEALIKLSQESFQTLLKDNQGETILIKEAIYLYNLNIQFSLHFKTEREILNRSFINIIEIIDLISTKSEQTVTSLKQQLVEGKENCYTLLNNLFFNENGDNKLEKLHSLTNGIYNVSLKKYLDEYLHSISLTLKNKNNLSFIYASKDAEIIHTLYSSIYEQIKPIFHNIVEDNSHIENIVVPFHFNNDDNIVIKIKFNVVSFFQSNKNIVIQEVAIGLINAFVAELNKGFVNNLFSYLSINFDSKMSEFEFFITDYLLNAFIPIEEN